MASASASTSAPATAGAVGTYVALGDSYTAAPGVPDTDLTTGCARSDHNYPALLAAATGAELVDVSCSGASTLSLIGVQQNGGVTLPAQFDALSEDTALVTLGIGGNDLGLFQTMVGTCAQLGAGDAAGSPCQDRFAPEGGPDQLVKRAQKIGDRVGAAVAGVHDRAPQAQVLLVGYPQPVPESGTCPILPLAAGDYAYVRSVTEALNAALEKAAQDNDATYVDVAAASAGHDICAGDQAWVNGSQTDLTRAIAFHPFAEEQQAVAGLIEQQLQG
ncbi:SGNH/GDSL hydrolase family protein [Nocardioides anomalus]|uniref:SGNH/GDSL hydrolase family protein n=1 Tax=Nocardioides anomalus TaxID=2712223 RepID=A0A6G6WM52_9ACTN|nr:SGNH/GDSL hydrolase family protein [Nocardioides anomalus]